MYTYKKGDIVLFGREVGSPVVGIIVNDMGYSSIKSAYGARFWYPVEKEWGGILAIGNGNIELVGRLPYWAKEDREWNRYIEVPLDDLR